ncbi:c-type cytochrome [Campylobacter sp. 19-13652]|uniref:c-type cytochrome n=1 Tax=Campylobacter sp. 19-13652 TaxID=2840180 RepID=UPI001C7679C1|nr:c-type cytochrome [Campylobacter sp. 19-13652]BCX80093.1 cbb3-type cytochrome c oxidase subunit [Campylobacter sp. 19-13652]
MQWLNLSDSVNLLSLIGAAVIIIATIIVVGRYVGQMKVKKDENVELSEHSWDGIGEYKNGLPFGWALIFVVLIVWAIWYMLFGYPVNSYSQIGEYNDEVAASNAKFNAKFAHPDAETLKAMGENIFLVQCSACHGISGTGINGKAANLTKWGSEDGIYNSIIKGSKGLNYPGGEMPSGADLGIDETTARAIAAYVAADVSAIKKTAHPELVEAGKEAYAACAACHGDDGKGMDGTFPDLTQYGSALFVVNVLNSGKQGFIGTMPKFDDNRLNGIQKQAVGEYVISLSKE